MKLREQLYDQCLGYVLKREATVTTIISGAQEALTSETKSSVGDKHETGRAMLQLEMEKAGQQLHGITLMKEILAKVKEGNISNIAHLGSIVTTNKRNYYLSISAGKLIVNEMEFFAVSVLSPIGKLLLGKTVEDSISFNGNTFKIEAIQ